MNSNREKNYLVEVERPKEPLIWIALFIFGFSAIMLIYISNSKSLKHPPLTSDEAQRLKIVNYLRQSEYDVVIVGSSLSQFFRREYFNNISAYNLSLPGGSALTGLNIIDSAKSLPRIVLVEGNLLYRPSDNKLIHKFKHLPSTLEDIRYALKDYKPLQSSLSSLLSIVPDQDVMIKRVNVGVGNSEYYSKKKENILSTSQGPTADLEKQEMRNREDESINYKNPTKVSLDDIARFASKWEKKGVKIYIYEMPFPENVSNNSFVKGTHNLIVEYIKTYPLLGYLDIKVDKRSLSWPDAHHLDERSAIITGLVLEKQLEVAGQTANR